MAAFGAVNSADPEDDDTVWKKDAALIIGMKREASRVTSGTGQLVELEAVNDRIVKILRKPIVIFNRNGYHCLCGSALAACGGA